MQQIQKTKYGKCYIGVMGTVWVAGLLIAGSDSSYMPWFNGIGLILFFAASFLMNKYFKPSHSNTGILVHPEAYQKASAKVRKPKKEKQRINTRYALGI